MLPGYVEQRIPPLLCRLDLAFYEKWQAMDRPSEVRLALRHPLIATTHRVEHLSTVKQFISMISQKSRAIIPKAEHHEEVIGPCSPRHCSARALRLVSLVFAA